MLNGFLRVATATLEIHVGNPVANSENIVTLMKEADANNVELLCFPELCLTGCTCGDLFFSNKLIRNARFSLISLVKQSKGLSPLFVVGVPLYISGKLYNCAVVYGRSRIWGIVPKKQVSLAEKKYFSDFNDEALTIHFEEGEFKKNIPFGSNFKFNTCYFECVTKPSKEEDTVASRNTSLKHLDDFTFVINFDTNSVVLNDSTIVCNLTASPELVTSAEKRRNNLKNMTSDLICGCIYANAGLGESTTDSVYSGHSLIVENGEILAENKLFSTGLTFVDMDVEGLKNLQLRDKMYKEPLKDYKIGINFIDYTSYSLKREIKVNPFIPKNTDILKERSDTIFELLSHALMTRLNHTKSKKVVLGLSGGLDSTMALLVMVRTMDIMGRPRNDIVAVSMPCFGTTDRTKNNALQLATQFGVEYREIDISKSVLQHFEDIGHDKNVYDITYENSQARERTQVLMDIANQISGFVVGTGDLSELAQGWCTFNGDHMSMYAVNADIPKTLMRELVKIEAMNYNELGKGNLAHILMDICNTPVSPELLPTENGKLVQTTENSIGPYELHDFFLYYYIKYGFSPKKIYFLAKHAFANKFTNEEIKYWMGCFFIRFFNQQFKRSCMPDGPKIGSIGLSPRGDLCMPSDADVSIWMEEIKDL